MSEFEPWHPDIFEPEPVSVRPPRDQGEHPVVSKPAINVDKMQFMLSYMIAARRSGRSTDTANSNERWEITNAASDLYDRAEAICKKGV